MNFIDILIGTAFLFLLGALLATLIVIISKKLAIEKNAQIDEIRSHLSGANCGACGFAGCDAFAEALYNKKISITDCPVTSQQKKDEINKILGLSGDNQINEKTYAIVHCNGGNACRDKYDYQGYGDCKTAELIAGGRKACYTGCLGQGTCVDKCPNYAIEVNDKGYSQVYREYCTSCGLCITNCPKSIIKRIRESAKVYCACSNRDKGKEVSSVCKNGCIACGICAKNCPENAITIIDNLPVFDYDKCSGCLICVKKCPTHCIKEIDKIKD
jgi:electron transport complex protein RnfB